MLKSIVILAALLAPVLAFALQGTPCGTEGLREYVRAGQGFDVYVCQKKTWNFLFHQGPSGPSDD